MRGGCMRLGASIWGFFHQQDPSTWPTLAGAVDETLAFDEGLGVEVWGSRALDQPMVVGQDLADLADVCQEAAYVAVHIQGQHWSWNPANLRHEIDFAHQVGANMLVLHPVCFGLVDEDDRPDWPEIIRIAEYAAKFGVRLAMENMPNSMWALDRILDEMGEDPEKTNLGICIDVGHAHLSTDAGREPVCNYLERYAGQLIHLHLHDNHGEYDDHLLPGEGTIDWPRVLNVLESIDFCGTAVLEAHQEGVAPQEGLARGIEFLNRLNGS
ncbi:sugar phosphate isomerase/epimerase family protein [Candidatus Bipolaricaulota bacterium]